MEKNEIVATVRSAEGETSDSIEKTIDFTELLLFFLNKLWIIVLITCVCGAGAYFSIQDLPLFPYINQLQRYILWTRTAIK